jgi:hypothetical protein
MNPHTAFRANGGCAVHCAALLAALLMAAMAAVAASASPPPPLWTLQARTVVTGLAGAHGIRQIGRFHAGGPFTMCSTRAVCW